MLAQRGIVALVAGLTLAGPLAADEVRGVIVRVDLERKEVQVEGRGLGKRGLGMTFTLGEDTRVLFGHDPGALADLAPGKRVRVVFDRGQRALSLHLFGFRPAREESPRAPAAGRPPAAGANLVAGVLQRVSYAEREVVVVGPGPKGAETETIVAVPKDVRVVQDGKVIPFDDLKDN